MQRLVVTFLLITACLLPNGAIAQSDTVQVADHDWYLDNYRAPSGSRYGWFWDAKLWVDIDLANLGFEKQVEVLWTTDAWQTVNVSPASFQTMLSDQDGWERWSAEFCVTTLRSCYWCESTQSELEFVIRYQVNGQTYWDNNQQDNYRLVISSSQQEK